MTSRGVIVYLTQANHSSYKHRDSQQQLHLSVRLLYQHYNAVQRDDVRFLHEGDVTPEQQRSVLSLCTPGTARFHVLPRHHFELPTHIDRTRRWQYPHKFSAGYRHMIRFFTISLWQFAEELGYEYVMRLDEDSYIWSPIRYNIFSHMRSRGLQYVYRLATWERGHANRNMDGFHQMVQQYARQRNVSLGWLLGPCASRLPAEFTRRHGGIFSTTTCGNMYCIYNNFFATRVSFWRRPDVDRFLQWIDRSGSIYYERYGDALWHSAALAMFAAPTELAMLRDFAYEHSTLVPAQVHTQVTRSNRTLILWRPPCRRASGAVAFDGRGCAEDPDGPPACLIFGGIALDETAAAVQPLAMTRMANLSLALLRCEEKDILYRSTCLVPARPADRRPQVLGLFSQRVTLEERSCDFEPRPFFCDARSWNYTRFADFHEELLLYHRAFVKWTAVRQARRDPRAEIRARTALHHNADFLFRQRQLRSQCFNYCAAEWPPSRRERECHRRATRMFLRLADDANSAVRLMSPPPAPPASARHGAAFSQWLQRRTKRAEPAPGSDPERYKFSDALAAPAR